MTDLSNKSNKDSICFTSEDGKINWSIDKDHWSQLIRDSISTSEEVSKTIFGSFDIEKQDIQELHLYLHDKLNEKCLAIMTDFLGITYFKDGSSGETHQFSKFTDLNSKNYKPSIVIGIHLSFMYLLAINDKPEIIGIEIIFNTEDGRLPRKILDTDSAKPISYCEISIRYSHGTWSYDVLNWLVEYIDTRVEVQSPLLAFIENSYSTIGTGFSFIFIGVYYGFIKTFSPSISENPDSVLQNAPLKSLTLEEKVDLLIKYFVNLSAPNEYDGLQAGLSMISLMTGFAISYALASVLVAFIRRVVQPTPSFIRFNDASESYRRKRLREVKYMWLKFIGSLALGLALNIVASYIYAYFTS